MTQEQPEQTAPVEQEKAPEVARTRSVSLPDLREEMDRLWATVMSSPWRPFRSLDTQKLLPSIDVFEKDGQLHVKVELPGMTASDVEITATEDSLKISGEKKTEREVKEENYHLSERSYGSFSRQVSIPPEADIENAGAKFTDGVLEITLPLKKTPPTAAKKIEIQG